MNTKANIAGTKPVSSTTTNTMGQAKKNRTAKAADLSTLTVIKRSKGSKYNPNDVLVITQDGATFYKAGVLPPQLHYLFNIVIELGVKATLEAVFYKWDELYFKGGTGQYTQDAVTIYNGHYKGYCEGTTAWDKGKRRALAQSLTGSATCQLLMVA